MKYLVALIIIGINSFLEVMTATEDWHEHLRREDGGI